MSGIFNKAGSNLMNNLNADPNAPVNSDTALDGSQAEAIEPNQANTDTLQSKEGNAMPTNDKTATQTDNSLTKDDLTSFKESLMQELKEKVLKAEEKPGQETGKVKEEVTQAEIDEAEKLLSMSDEDLRDQFFENPKEVIRILTDAGIKKEIENLKPIIEDYNQKQTAEKTRQQVAEFAKDKPDFKQLSPMMSQIIEQEGLSNNPNALEIAYYKAKAMSGQQIDDSRKTLDEFLGDDSTIEQIAGNEKLQDKIISEYLKKVAKGEVAPKSISNSDGTPAVGTGSDDSPKSFKDAKERLLRRL